MEFRTKVEIPTTISLVSEDEHILVMGSCFAASMGEMLLQYKFHCLVNPFGVLYNPLSLFQALRGLLSGTYDAPRFLFCNSAGIWGSWLHSTAFSASDREESIGRIQASFCEAVAQLDRLDCLVLTFGTDHCYRLRQNGLLVSNCHKQPTVLFSEETPSLGQMLEEGTRTLAALLERRPSLRVILTVSPYRYLKYGLHGSRLSKAALLLLTQELEKRFPRNVNYFPAYEILEDELRDYRFYAEDMVHPSEQAVRYIWQQFVQTRLSDSARQYITDWIPLNKALAHVSQTISSPEHRLFLERTRRQLMQFGEHYPHADISAEKEKLANLLS